MSLFQEIADLLARSPGLTDREITNLLRGRDAPQQPVNTQCRLLATQGRLERRRRSDGLLGNWLAPISQPAEQVHLIAAASASPSAAPQPTLVAIGAALSEDELKRFLIRWLEADGWRVVVAWGKARGIDIDATRGGDRWIIEAKGAGSLPAMRVNYFLHMLGETLQRMTDPRARYSIATPDMRQFRGLWNRLPELAKTRTGISALFVDTEGGVDHVRSASTDGNSPFPGARNEFDLAPQGVQPPTANDARRTSFLNPKGSQ